MLIAGNWKMNLMPHEGMMLTHEICMGISDIPSHVDILICPPFTHLAQCSLIIENNQSPLLIGAQNCHDSDEGAFTGEISARMLASMAIDYVILGHSERRSLFNESNDFIARKCLAAFKAGLTPIVCIGETLEQRNQGIVNQVIQEQVLSILHHEQIVSSIPAHDIVFAYEPVWAIGTGLAASPEQAENVHAFIRMQLEEKLGDHAAMVDVIYGGSVKPENAKDYFLQPNIDGALIGGASLKAESFLAIAAQA
ncbi:MAG: triose-phosphate isomerase [Ignavibacteria bacterium]|nr:triose-phosphate isomerase [Ignavibacteria bacterium]